MAGPSSPAAPGLRSPNWIPGLALVLILVILTEAFVADSFSSSADPEFRHKLHRTGVLLELGGGLAAFSVGTIICFYILRPVQQR